MGLRWTILGGKVLSVLGVDKGKEGKLVRTVTGKKG